MISNTILLAGFLRRAGDLPTVTNTIEFLVDFQPDERQALRDSMREGRDLDGLLEVIGEPRVVLQVIKIVIGCSNDELGALRAALDTGSAPTTTVPSPFSVSPVTQTHGDAEASSSAPTAISTGSPSDAAAPIPAGSSIEGSTSSTPIADVEETDIHIRDEGQVPPDDATHQAVTDVTRDSVTRSPTVETEIDDMVEILPDIHLGSPVSSEDEMEVDGDVDADVDGIVVGERALDEDHDEDHEPDQDAMSESGWFDEGPYTRNHRRPGLRPIPHQHQAYTRTKVERNATPNEDDHPRRVGPTNRLVVEIPVQLPIPHPPPIDELLAEWIPHGPWDERRMIQMTRVQFVASFADVYDWQRGANGDVNPEDNFMRDCAAASRRPVARIDRLMKPFKGSSPLRLFCYYHGHLIRRLSPSYDQHIHLRTVELRHTISAMIDLPE